ncbi:MAG: GAF domain-containing sensor histidine kinase [Janthinobacterium lividum]
MTLPISRDIRAVQSIPAVPTILRVIAENTGLRWVCVSRVTESNWTMCAVHDQLDFGLAPGDEIEIADTFCDQVRRENVGVVIDSAATDPIYCAHPIPKKFDIESYFSIPVYRKDGAFFGTLCGLDPAPAALKAPKTLDMLKLFAELLSNQIDSELRVQELSLQLEDERENSELREQFIAVLGHDIRTPLTTMMAGAEMLTVVSGDAKVGTIAGRIQRSGQRIAGLIEDVMDFTRSKLGGGLLPLNVVESLTLGEFLGHAVAELRTNHPARELVEQIGIARAITCDPGRLAQMLSNLVINALVHGYAHTPVRILASCDAGRLAIAVENHGKPIPQEIQVRLFQPFSRGREKNQADGLGLGLYIASEIAKAHGGVLRLETEGERTCFICEIDLQALA